jgi:MarR family transcriptional regulator, organic hydroperoxide resistance regulator
MENPGVHEENISGHRVISVLRQTHDFLLKIRQQELSKYDITPEQASALMVIHAFGNKATTAEISRRLFREPNSIGVLIRRLERRGFVNRIPDKNRKNIIRVSLTEKGIAAYHHAMEMKAYNRIVKRMPDKKKRQLLSLLEKLRNYALQDMKVNVKSYSDFAKKISDLDHE